MPESWPRAPTELQRTDRAPPGLTKWRHSGSTKPDTAPKNARTMPRSVRTSENSPAPEEGSRPDLGRRISHGSRSAGPALASMIRPLAFSRRTNPARRSHPRSDPSHRPNFVCWGRSWKEPAEAQRPHRSAAKGPADRAFEARISLRCSPDGPHHNPA